MTAVIFLTLQIEVSASGSNTGAGAADFNVQFGARSTTHDAGIP